MTWNSTSRHNWKQAAAAVTLAAVLVPAAAGSAEAKPKPSKQQIADQRHRAAAAKRKAADQQKKVNAAKTHAAELADKAEKAQSKAEGAQIASTKAAAVLTRATVALAAATENVASAKREVGALAVDQYASGGLPPTMQLSLSNDPSQFLEGLQLAGRLADRQTKVTSLMRQAEATQASATEQANSAAQTAQQAAQAAAKDNAAAQQASQQADVAVTAAEKLETSLLGAAKVAQQKADELAKQRALAIAAEKAAAEEARRRAAAAAAHPSAGASVPGDASAAQAAVHYALSKLGHRYVWGATGPEVFDCSGLMMWAYAQAGVTLPHFTGDQYNVTRPIPVSELRPGDLVFFGKPVSYHVGMYIGDGQMLQAPRTGDVVKISSIYSQTAPPYASRVVG